MTEAQHNLAPYNPPVREGLEEGFMTEWAMKNNEGHLPLQVAILSSVMTDHGEFDTLSAAAYVSIEAAVAGFVEGEKQEIDEMHEGNPGMYTEDEIREYKEAVDAAAVVLADQKEVIHNDTFWTVGISALWGSRA